MRSRFTAFVLELEDYLLQSWHGSTRPAQLNLDAAPNWQSLQILSADEQGDEGQVTFRAIYHSGDNWGFLEEDSTFVREDGHWYYVSGDTREGALKPGRNDPCPCGSGRKHKACCL